jgi:hypothetical protein
MAKKKSAHRPCLDLTDYPDSMSLYQRESLAAEARLAAERIIKKQSDRLRAESQRLSKQSDELAKRIALLEKRTFLK